jgi:hypothetical protein
MMKIDGVPSLLPAAQSAAAQESPPRQQVGSGDAFATLLQEIFSASKAVVNRPDNQRNYETPQRDRNQDWLQKRLSAGELLYTFADNGKEQSPGANSAGPESRSVNSGIEAREGAAARGRAAAKASAEATNDALYAGYDEAAYGVKNEQGTGSAASGTDNESAREFAGVSNERKDELLARLKEELGEGKDLAAALMPWLMAALLGEAAGEEGSLGEKTSEGLARGLGFLKEHGLLQQEALALLEQKLISGEIALLEGNGRLTPEAGAVFAAYLSDERVLTELKALFPEFEEKGEKFAARLSEALADKLLPGTPGKTGNESAKAAELPLSYTVEESTVKQEPVTFWERMERFLNSILTGEKGMSAKPPGEEGSKMNLQGEQPSEKGDALTNAAKAGEVLFTALNRPDEPAAMADTKSRAPLWQPREVMNQVMDKLTMLSRPGVQEVRIKLHPEFLGEIFVRMRNVRGVLSAEIMTSDPAVKEMLESQLDSLRQRFQQMNMQVDEFHVMLNNEGSKKQDDEDSNQQQGQQANSLSGGNAGYGDNEKSPLDDFDDAYRVNSLV